MKYADNTNQLLLLHLSDIHFEEPICLNPETDHDHPVRELLVRDIKKMVERLGIVDAILISGDVAHKAHEYEYAEAKAWFDEVCNVCGCPKYRIYVVPGNHDVNREIAKMRAVEEARQKINNTSAIADRDRSLYLLLSDENIGPDLFKPMEEYNKFAASFGCDINTEKPNWIEDLDLADGWKLRIYGLTTTFFSGPDDDVKGDLYLGPHQRVFTVKDGIIKLVMMHHPPDWMHDQYDIDDAFQNCDIQLFGHRHRQRYDVINNSVRLSAGAVNPSRNEGNWEPGYNFIQIGVFKEESGNHNLHISSYLRKWQSSPDLFVSKYTDDDIDVFFQNTPLKRNPLPPMISKVSFENDNISEDKTMITNTANSNVENTATKENTNIEKAASARRDLVLDFWGLSASQRRIIVQKLGLYETSDDSLPEPQRYRLAFERAQKMGVIEAVAELVDHYSAK